jgi:Fur family ferric uptake transcriptional regulator
MDLPPLPESRSADDSSAAMAPLCAVFRRYLKSRSLKYTPERADILDAIIERDDVFEAEELLLEMRRRGYRVSKATIYRTIKLLQTAGIITQALFDSKQAHYQLIYGKAPRDSMVCMKTGVPDLRDQPGGSRGVRRGRRRARRERRRRRAGRRVTAGVSRRNRRPRRGGSRRTPP